MLFQYETAKRLISVCLLIISLQNQEDSFAAAAVFSLTMFSTRFVTWLMNPITVSVVKFGSGQGGW